jgi:hypothetical protein
MERGAPPPRGGGGGETQYVFMDRGVGVSDAAIPALGSAG